MSSPQQYAYNYSIGNGKDDDEDDDGENVFSQFFPHFVDFPFHKNKTKLELMKVQFCKAFEHKCRLSSA